MFHVSCCKFISSTYFMSLNNYPTNSSLLTPRSTLQHGIIPPIVTPLISPDELDVAGLERLINRVLSGGVHGVFILGTTGEAPGLSYRLRRELIDYSSRFIAGRVPLLVGVSDTAFDETASLARFAADHGAAAAVLAPPYYFPATGAQLRQYYDQAVQSIPIPTILYHMPELTKVHFDLEFLDWALDNPRIIALKDSSGNLDFFWRACQMTRRRDDFPVFVGPEHLLEPALRLGGAGGVNGGANLWPELFVNMYEMVRANNLVEVGKIQNKIDQLGQIYQIASGGLGVTRGLKRALQRLNICGECVVPPFYSLPIQEARLIDNLTDELFNGGLD